MDVQIRYLDLESHERIASLPETLANLSNDQVSSFPALRAHQKQPWHCFIVQLATLAMQSAGRASLPTEAEDWLELLRGLTPE